MQVEEVATIPFEDTSSGDQGVAIIRATKGQMLLCISLERDGDVEVALGAGDSAKFLAALQKAIAIVQGNSPNPMS